MRRSTHDLRSSPSLHYKQNHPEASYFSLLCLSLLLILLLPAFLRSCYYLLPFVNLLSSSFSFPLVVLFHDLFPSNVVIVLTLVLKTLVFLDSFQFVVLRFRAHV